MLLDNKTILQLRSVMDFLVLKHSEEFVAQKEYAPYGDTEVVCGCEISDEDYQKARQLAKEDFSGNFEEHNNWIDQSEFQDLNEYERAKQEIIKYVEGL